MEIKNKGIYKMLVFSDFNYVLQSSFIESSSSNLIIFRVELQTCNKKKILIGFEFFN